MLYFFSIFKKKMTFHFERM